MTAEQGSAAIDAAMGEPDEPHRSGAVGPPACFLTEASSKLSHPSPKEPHGADR